MKFKNISFIVALNGSMCVPLVMTGCSMNDGILWLTNMPQSINLSGMWCVIPSMDNCWETDAAKWSLILPGNFSIIEFNNDVNDDINRNNVTIEIGSEIASNGAQIEDVGVYFPTNNILSQHAGVYYNQTDGWTKQRSYFQSGFYTDEPNISYYSIQLDDDDDLIVTGGILIGRSFPKNFFQWANQIYFCEAIPSAPPIR